MRSQFVASPCWTCGTRHWSDNGQGSGRVMVFEADIILCPGEVLIHFSLCLYIHPFFFEVHFQTSFNISLDAILF